MSKIVFTIHGCIPVKDEDRKMFNALRRAYEKRTNTPNTDYEREHLKCRVLDDHLRSTRSLNKKLKDLIRDNMEIAQNVVNELKNRTINTDQAISNLQVIIDRINHETNLISEQNGE